LVVMSAFGAAARVSAEDRAIHEFRRQELTDVYYSEGAAAGDIDGDGTTDIVYGPHWYAGPDFRVAREIYAAKPQPTERYADHFFAWIYDFDGDGDGDVFTVGFPGTPAYVYENPGKGKYDEHWTKHQVFDWVSNESPWFTDIVGDERPELVCTRDGRYGYATIDFEKPFAPWTFHAVSEKIAADRFGHGLGVGDVDGDGRRDIIFAGGWLEQPDDLSSGELWKLHEVAFTNSYGGAEMHAYDVDGDGDNDIITSLAAHDFGLAWYEQVVEDGKRTFKQRTIMGVRPDENRYGLVFTEPHSVALADMDGDGLKDIVTGKTYWSHHRQSPLWDAGAVVYWFRLVRGSDGVDWVPYLADGDAGIGRQVVVHDVNADGLLDIVTGGMKGGNVLFHRRVDVDEARWRDAQPKPYRGGSSAAIVRGPQAEIEESTGTVASALEAENLKATASGGTATKQGMSGFKKDRWSGGAQLFWNGAKSGDRLELELPVEKAGTYEITTVLTRARDYGIVRILIGDRELVPALDLFDWPDVVTTGVLTLGREKLEAGKHRLVFEITGANRAAAAGHRVGIDWVKLERVD
ncbi:MAG TPA: VCBS repeat-containing protein, partial [Planctomycetota bacterium]|nr:VCBS repeat-containing protein [Planctomycetota bacterium]